MVATTLDLFEDFLSLLRVFVLLRWGFAAALNIISLRRLPTYGQIHVHFSADSPPYSEYLAGKHRGYDVRFGVEASSDWEAKGFDQLATSLVQMHAAKPIPELERRIASCIVWCGGMLEEQDIRDCFLRGISAVETVTSGMPPTGSQVGRKLREFGATLRVLQQHPALLDQGVPLSSACTKLFTASLDMLRDAYEERCNISHGEPRVNSMGDAPLMLWRELIVDVCLGALALAKVSSVDCDFNRQLQDLRMRLIGN